MSDHGGLLSGSGARRLLTNLALPLIGGLVALLLWWGSIALFVAEGDFLTRFAPAPTFQALRSLMGSGELWPHLVASTRRTLVGLAISAAVGLPLGLAVGYGQTFARMSGAVFQFVRMVSPLSWTPLAIIIFGVGDAPVYFLVAIGGVWPIVLNTAAGVAALDRRWVTVARSLGANRLEIARTVVWPGIRSHILTGLRLSVGLAWIILVPAEMLGVDSGLGYFILDARDRLAYSELMAAILIIGVYGFLIDAAARWLLRERRSGARARRRSGSAAPAASLAGGPS